MKVFRVHLAVAAALLLSFSYAFAGQPTPLTMQIDRTADPSPVCANRLTSYSGCDQIGTIGSNHVWSPNIANATGLSSSQVKTALGYTPLSPTSPALIYQGASTSLIDLQTTPPSNGSFFHPTGTYLQFCSIAGCLTGPYMFGQSVLDATTRLDGTAQEIGAAFNFTNNKGYAPNWKPSVSSTAWALSTSYAASAIVSSNSGLFQNRGACTSAASGVGPGFWQTPGYGAVEPTANNIPDNTCTWDYYGAATYAAYSGVGSSTALNVTEVSNAGNIYQNTVAACVPASSGSGPTGTGTGIVDGTCRWGYVGPGLNDGKSGMSLASVAALGGGDHWGRVENHVIMPGFGASVWYGSETDYNNQNMDSYAGAPMLAIGHFTGGGSAQTYPLFAYEYLGSGAVNSGSRNPYGAHNGWFCSGQPGDVGSVVKDSCFADASNAASSFQILAGRTHNAGFEDDSNSTVSYLITGTHNVGIDLSAATISSGNAIRLPTGSFVQFNAAGSADLMGYNGAIGALTYGATNSGTAFTFAAYDDGDFAVGANLNLVGSTPTINFITSYAGTPGSINKINFYNNSYGIGVSGGSVDYVTASSGQHAFYTSTTIDGTISTSGFNLLSGVYMAGSTAGVTCATVSATTLTTKNGIVTHC